MAKTAFRPRQRLRPRPHFGEYGVSSISKALNEAVVKRLAGEGTYARGLDYYRTGRVESIEESGGELRAVVVGNRDYTVVLSSDEGVLDYSCNCPQGNEGVFCKHCVAAALAWLRRPSDAGSKRGRAAKKITLADAANLLREEDKETLVSMILEWARQNGRLEERLLIYAARRTSPEAVTAAILRAFREAVHIHGYLRYHEAAGWARDVHEAIGPIEKLLEDGHATYVIELCEAALEELTYAAGSLDDSDGHLGGLRERLEELHLRACTIARPEPRALARRLFEWERMLELDIFYGAAERYAKVLGKEGLEEYRKLAEEEWKKVPVLRPGSRNDTWVHHHRITSIMESLARASGDVEQLVAVLSRDLSHPYNFLRIAEAYRAEGKLNQALAWAEKGLEAFQDDPDPRLVEFVAEEYHRRGRHDEAMDLIWTEFCRFQSLTGYRELRAHAKKAGNWPHWRERALAEIRQKIARNKSAPRREPLYSWESHGGGHSLLVEIFLDENNLDAAWREAQQGGCSNDLWLKLAAAREKEHPEDAVPIYWEQARKIVAARTNGVYEDAVELLEKTAALMHRMNRSEEFTRNLEALRNEYRRKRNFLKLLDQKQRSLYLS